MIDEDTHYDQLFLIFCMFLDDTMDLKHGGFSTFVLIPIDTRLEDTSTMWISLLSMPQPYAWWQNITFILTTKRLLSYELLGAK
jgi:hypothetical protein